MADYSEPCGCDESLRLREKNRKLRDALMFLRAKIWAGSISPMEFAVYVTEKLEETKEK